MARKDYRYLSDVYWWCHLYTFENNATTNIVNWKKITFVEFDNIDSNERRKQLYFMCEYLSTDCELRIYILNFVFSKKY